MKAHATFSLFRPVFAARMSDTSLEWPLTAKNATALFWLSPRLPQKSSPESAPQTNEAPLIYAVDDMPHLTELYTTLLESRGYTVQAFNDRVEALASLKANNRKPDLLITDYVGHSMPVDQFLGECRLVHPRLRILMASGLDQPRLLASRIKPDRFIRKPFSLEDLAQEVKAALVT